jgi:hypothetical protein
VLGRERGIVELVEDAELFFEQERAVERLVGLPDFVQQRELGDRLLGGRLEQRPAGGSGPPAGSSRIAWRRSSSPTIRAEEKLVDVVGLYLNPPENAIVLCMDEKSQIQALDRTQPSLPIKPGRGGTMTHD